MVKIFKKSFKSFFANANAMIYVMAFVYFSATLFFGLVLVGFNNALTDFTSKLSVMLQDQAVSIKVEADSLVKILQQNNSVDAFKQLLTDFADSLSIRGENMQREIRAAIDYDMRVFVTYFSIGIAVLGMGFFVGSFLCQREIKIKENVKRGIKRSVAGWFLNTVVFASLLSVATYLINLFPWTAPISGFVIALLQSFFSLWRAAILQRGRKNALSNLNFKDVIGFILINYILYLVGFGCAFGLMALSGSAVIGLIIALPLLVYSKQFLDSYALIYIAKKDEIIEEQASNGVH